MGGNSQRAATKSIEKKDLSIYDNSYAIDPPGNGEDYDMLSKLNQTPPLRFRNQSSNQGANEYDNRRDPINIHEAELSVRQIPTPLASPAIKRSFQAANIPTKRSRNISGESTVKGFALPRPSTAAPLQSRKNSFSSTVASNSTEDDLATSLVTHSNQISQNINNLVSQNQAKLEKMSREKSMIQKELNANRKDFESTRKTLSIANQSLELQRKWKSVFLARLGT